MRSAPKLLISAAMFAAVLSTTVVAGQPAIGTRIPVTVGVAGSAAAQIQKCQQMRASIGDAGDESAKLQRVLEVMANLDVVRNAWPKQTDAIADAALIQAEIAMEFRMPRNAADSLAAALPYTAKTRHEPRLEYRLGSAYEATGQLMEAENHFKAAEASPYFKKLDRFEADDALQQIAMFYMRQNRPRESMKRFRAAADLPDQTPALKALHRLFALKEAVRLTDDAGRAEAKRDAQALREAVRDARDTAKNPRHATDARFVANVERDMQRVLADSGL